MSKAKRLEEGWQENYSWCWAIFNLVRFLSFILGKRKLDWFGSRSF